MPDTLDMNKSTAKASIAGIAIRSLLDVVFPPQCRLCRDAIPSSAGSFCDGCWTALRGELAENTCPTCGAPLPPINVSDSQCPRCRGKKPRVKGMACITTYRGAFGDAIKQYKYQGRQELETVLSEWLAESIDSAPWRSEVQAVVPVPTCWRHRIGRPLHASEHLARLVARQTELPYAPVLRRTRGGRHQVGLPYNKRVANIRGAFAVRGDVELHQARLLIVDDVRTTGATINECAKVLLAAGAAAVYAAVAATVARPTATLKPPAGA